MTTDDEPNSEREARPLSQTLAPQGVATDTNLGT